MDQLLVILRLQQTMSKLNQEMQMHTEDEEIQAFVWQVFINQYFLLFFRATSQEPNQITVLEFGYQLDFIFELYETLS